jgi:predicted metal-dependent phosphoesterase TrpH
MINVEFHCHTIYSKDCLVSIEDLHAAARKKELDRVVVTDHNTIKGALKAVEQDRHRFIAGEEIMTQQGELLGMFMSEFIPPGMPAMNTIELLRAQGAFISVSHPFDTLREGGWELSNLVEITPHIDAIEVFNSRCMLPHFNARASIYARQHNLLVTVGSDSHSTSELGAATLILHEFNDTASLKVALRTAQFNTHYSGLWVHFYSRYAAWRKRAAFRTP